MLKILGRNIATKCGIPFANWISFAVYFPNELWFRNSGNINRTDLYDLATASAVQKKTRIAFNRAY